MSKEAMKLALEALERMKGYGNVFLHHRHTQNPYEQVCEAITALREALAEQPAQQEFVSPGGGYVPAIPVQQALDKMAENARELGLDYEPAQCKYPKCNYPCPDLPDCRDAEQPAQQQSCYCPNCEALSKELAARQEPVATLYGTLPVYDKPAQQEPVAWGLNRFIEDDNGCQIGTDDPELTWGKYPSDDSGWWPLYTSPQPAQQEPVKAMHIGFDWLDNKQLVATYAVPVATNLYAPDLYTTPQAQPAQQELTNIERHERNVQTFLGEQPAQQEPVAWMIWTHGPVLVFMNKDEANMEFDRLNHAYPVPTRMLVPLYTSPPAQRTWVGLTDKEVMELAFNFDVPSLVVRTVEAKLREKNNG